MISIVIPTLNESKLIKDTLSRLKRGLTLPHEIIVSDGKSKDDTVLLAQGLADHVIVHDKEVRQTISQGRNAGARLAKGDFLVFMDADCRFDNPNAFFERALAHFHKNPKLVAVAAYIRVFPEDETLADKIVWSLMNAGNRTLNRLGIGGAPGEFQMIRKDVFDRLGGYNEKLIATEDYDMFGRLSKVGSVRLKKDLVVYHSGRHGHTLGWPKLLWLWFANTFSYYSRGKSYSKEWEPIR